MEATTQLRNEVKEMTIKVEKMKNNFIDIYKAMNMNKLRNHRCSICDSLCEGKDPSLLGGGYPYWNLDRISNILNGKHLCRECAIKALNETK